MRTAITQRLITSLKPQPRPFEVRDTRLPGFIVRVQPSGVMSYVVEFARGQRHTLGKVTVLSLDKARGQAREILAHGPPQPVPTLAAIPILQEFLTERYAPWVRHHRKDAQGALNRVTRQFIPTLGNTRLDELTPLVIEACRTERLNAGIQRQTVNRDTAALKGLLSHAVQWGVIAVNPLAGLKAPASGRAIVRYLTHDEEQRLRAALEGRGGHLRPMVLISLNTGLRQGELFSLTWDDVDFTQSLLTVRSENAKSGRTRHLPLNAEALTVLREWRGDSQTGLVFPSRTGRRIDNVQKSWSTVLKTAAISDFRWHDLRHSFASHLVMRGVSLAVVRELLGHASMEMTLRYSHLAPENLREAVSRLS